MKARFYILTGIFSVLFTLLGYKLYSLQILKGSDYVEKVAARNELAERQSLRRGQIFFSDKNGASIPVALNKEFPHIIAIPKEIQDAPEAAKMFASILGISEAKLENIFSSKLSYYSLMDKANEEVVTAVNAAGIPGVEASEAQYRYNPFGSLASQVIGFVGKTDKQVEPIGLYGIEKLNDERLAKGDDISFTIDRNLQAEAEQVLDKLIEEHKASGGSILIQEPKTGKILAMASAPDFNPNEYSDAAIKTFTNPAVQAQYEPGSVFKPLTMSAGIDSGSITPDTTFVDTGRVKLNGKTITNWDHKAHGKITMTNVIEDSVNTGTIFAQQRMGREIFYSYLKKFGLGALTNIDLPDEVKGDLRNLERKNAPDIDYATASYGQGTGVTPVQLITAFSAIANGGLLMRPYVSADTKPYVVRRVISEETALKVTRMMESAVEKAKLAAIPEYRIAGKTGTAFIPENGKYNENALIHSYVGFAPAEDAKFVILMKLDRPDKPLAGATVVPKFKEIAQFALNYYDIAPDKLTTVTP